MSPQRISDGSRGYPGVKNVERSAADAKRILFLVSKGVKRCHGNKMTTNDAIHSNLILRDAENVKSGILHFDEGNLAGKSNSDYFPHDGKTDSQQL